MHEYEIKAVYKDGGVGDAMLVNELQMESIMNNNKYIVSHWKIREVKKNKNPVSK
jgi:hypothetical protein